MRKKYKTCWISDLHLGSKSSVADMIYDFLKSNDFDLIYLNGDIIDIWRLKKAGFLNKKKSQSHINVLQRILKLSNKGTKIIYIIGNHDEFINHFIEDDSYEMGNIEIRESCIHETSNGMNYIVMHGHQFDLITKYSPIIAKLGDSGYHFTIWLNKINTWFRRKLGLRYWSLSKYIKIKVKKAANFISRFEEYVVKQAIEKDCDGIIVGHIHEPAIKNINEKLYLNSGCWTDIANCTALVENSDGEIELIRWSQNGKEQRFGTTKEASEGRDILLPSDYICRGIS